MAIKIEARCPAGHFLWTSFNDMPNTSNLNMAANIRVQGKCPLCGYGPMEVSSGYYEQDATGLMKRTGDFRPQS